MSSYTGAVRPVSAHMGRRRPGTATATRRAPLYDYPQRPKSQARGRSKENTTPDTEGGILNPGENDDPHSAAWAAQKIASTTSGGSLRDYQFGATLGKGTFGKVCYLRKDTVVTMILSRFAAKAILYLSSSSLYGRAGQVGETSTDWGACRD